MPNKPIKDLSGKQFGKLTALYPLNERKNNKVVWRCRCSCGNECDVTGTALSIGNTTSCGCKSKKHGMFGTRIYNVWHTMKERCYVESQISYKNYGGRGIKVCEEWQEFIPFMEWAYANGYDENAKRGECTLDRIDVNGDYCPENCRWVSQKVQSNNMRTNNRFIYNGIEDTLSNHARREGIDPRCVETRWIKGIRGSALFKKPKTSNRKILQYDKDMNLIKEWSNANEINEILGINPQNIRQCCNKASKTSYGYIWRYKEDDN